MQLWIIEEFSADKSNVFSTVDVPVIPGYLVDTWEERVPDNLWSYITYYEYPVTVEGAHDAYVYLEVSLVRCIFTVRYHVQ